MIHCSPPLFIAQSDSNALNGGLGEVTGELMRRMDILTRPDDLLELLAQMSIVTAAVIVVVGLLCVLNGYRWHKWLVMALAFMFGLGLGHVLSEHVGKSAIVAVALGLLCAIVATPLLKIAVALFGGLTGAFIGANIWAVIQGTAPDMSWVGAAMGFIVLAMASLIVFRLVIVLFTSIGGAAMIVLGLITLLLHVEPWAPAVHSSLTANEMLIPLLVTVAAVAGFVLQQSRIKAEGGGEQPKQASA